MGGIEIASWITAISTAFYAIVILVTAVLVLKQLREQTLLRESSVLKDAYDYIVLTHGYRKKIYDNKKRIKRVSDRRSLEKFKKNCADVYEAIQRVANCYHYIGILMKHGLLANKQAFFEEGGETFQRIYEIIKPVIVQERVTIGSQTYKQYLEYLNEEMKKWKGGPNRGTESKR